MERDVSEGADNVHVEGDLGDSHGIKRSVWLAQRPCILYVGSFRNGSRVFGNISLEASYPRKMSQR